MEYYFLPTSDSLYSENVLQKYRQKLITLRKSKEFIISITTQEIVLNEKCSNEKQKKMILERSIKTQEQSKNS